MELRCKTSSWRYARLVFTGRVVFLMLVFLSACTLEEQNNTGYTMDAECGENKVIMFNLNGERVINANTDAFFFEVVEDTVVFRSISFHMGKAYQIDMLFFINGESGNCPELKGEASAFEILINDLGQVDRAYPYPIDCSFTPRLQLRNYDPVTKSACGTFQFKLTRGIHSLTITNGFFDF